MKIECEYCGTEYDLSEQACCPSCGANSGNNENADQLRELQIQKEELEIREREIQLRTQQLKNDQAQAALDEKNKQNRVGRSARLLLLTVLSPILLVIFFGIVIGIIRTVTRSSRYTSSSLKTETSSSISKVEEIISGTAEGINNKVNMGTYTIMCDHIELADDIKQSTTEDRTFVRFHLVMECLDSKGVWPFKTLSCTADGFMCSSIYDTNHKKFPSGKLTENVKAEGTYTFEVPKDALEVVLTYDNTVEIKFINLVTNLLLDDITTDSTDESSEIEDIY